MYKRQVNCNAECSKVNLISSPSIDGVNCRKSKQESIWGYSLEKCPSTRMESLRRKTHYGSHGDSKEHKHKKLNKKLNSGNNLNNLQHVDQGQRSKQQDAGIMQEEQLIDGTDICVKLSITPDGTPKIIKPRFAKNVLEVRKIIKMKRKLQIKIDEMLKNKERCINANNELNKTHKKCIGKHTTLAKRCV